MSSANQKISQCYYELLGHCGHARIRGYISCVYLGVDQKANVEVIKKAYRKAALQWHP
jgi:hypothetical protein